MLRVLRAKGTAGVSSAMSTRMSSATEFKVALFDATGTLMNLAEAPGKTYSRIAAAHGVPCPSSEELDARFRGVIGDTPPVEYAGPRSADAATREMVWWREVVARVFGEGATHSGFNECFDALYAHYGRGEAWALYPEALPTIDALKRDGWTVGVLSNFDSRLEPVLTDLGVFQASDFFVLPRDSGLIKPDPGQPPPLPLPHMIPCAVALQRDPAALYPASPIRAGPDPCRAQGAQGRSTLRSEQRRWRQGGISARTLYAASWSATAFPATCAAPRPAACTPCWSIARESIRQWRAALSFAASPRSRASPKQFRRVCGVGVRRCHA